GGRGDLRSRAGGRLHRQGPRRGAYGPRRLHPHPPRGRGDVRLPVPHGRLPHHQHRDQRHPRGRGDSRVPTRPPQHQPGPLQDPPGNRTTAGRTPTRNRPRSPGPLLRRSTPGHVPTVPRRRNQNRPTKNSHPSPDLCLSPTRASPQLTTPADPTTQAPETVTAAANIKTAPKIANSTEGRIQRAQSRPGGET